MSYNTVQKGRPLPRKEEKTCSCVPQHSLPPKRSGGPSSERISGLIKSQKNCIQGVQTST